MNHRLAKEIIYLKYPRLHPDNEGKYNGIDTIDKIIVIDNKTTRAYYTLDEGYLIKYTPFGGKQLKTYISLSNYEELITQIRLKKINQII